VAALWDLGTTGVHVQAGAPGTLVLIAYFPERPGLASDLVFSLAPCGAREVERVPIPDVDWVARFREGFRAFDAGGFRVVPEWDDASAAGTDRLVLRMLPGRAFGTGTHETTKLCLKAINEIYKPGMSFLDIGTGTGILAIAAAKTQGMSHAFRRDEQPTDWSDKNILAIELDADSVAIARENARTNLVADKIEFVHGVLTDDAPRFDFVCANVTLDVISPILPLLLDKTKRHLVLSGILSEQQNEIVEQLRELGIDAPLIERDGEWISLRTVC